MTPHQIILKPRVTEQSHFEMAAHNVYTFEVHAKANKVQVREAIKALFDVTATKVTIQNRAGKLRRTRLGTGVTANKRIARVTLAEGQQIEGV